MLVRPTLGGSAVRIRLANTFGEGPVTFAAVGVAVAAGTGPALEPETSRAVTFGGSQTVTVPAGGRVLSDPVALALRYGQDLVVDLGVSRHQVTVTGHASAGFPCLAAQGNQVGEGTGAPFTTRLSSWLWLEAVDVVRDPGVGDAVVVLGDSLADGRRSGPAFDRRWTDLLAARLNRLPAEQRHAVLNQGVAGNRVLRAATCCGANDAALTRLGRDALTQAGTGTVIIAVGVNDVRDGASAGSVIAGLSQLAAQARAAGLRTVGVTLTPFGCDLGCPGAEVESVRAEVNAWIRSGEAYDGVIDADRILRDPERPDRLLSAYDCGDHLHLNDAGNAAMAAGVDLAVLDGTAGGDRAVR